MISLRPGIFCLAMAGWLCYWASAQTVSPGLVRRKLSAENDYTALSALYSSAGGGSDTWDTVNRWMTGYPCTNSWQGISCADGEVKALNLAKGELKGSLPSEISLLTAVTSFYPSRNTLSGTVPTEVGRLTALT